MLILTKRKVLFLLFHQFTYYAEIEFISEVFFMIIMYNMNNYLFEKIGIPDLLEI